jgi:hypothetical protein
MASVANETKAALGELIRPKDKATLRPLFLLLYFYLNYFTIAFSSPLA